MSSVGCPIEPDFRDYTNPCGNLPLDGNNQPSQPRSQSQAEMDKSLKQKKKVQFSKELDEVKNSQNLMPPTAGKAKLPSDSSLSDILGLGPGDSDMDGDVLSDMEPQPGGDFEDDGPQ